MTVEIGTAVGRPGEVTKGQLRVGSLADGSPIQLPVFIATGRKDGPTVWIEGCIHGEEYGGAVSIIQLMKTIDVGALRGTVIGIPCANPPSYNFRSRVSQIDGQNLNRIFPGSMAGSYSFQLAAVIGEHLGRYANFLLDLHSGGIGAEVPFYVIYKDDGSETAAKSKQLAKNVGCDTIWRVKEVAGMGGTVTAEASRRGIPSLTIEVGGGTFLPQHLENYLIAINGFLRGTGVLPGEAPKQKRYTIISDGAFIHNKEGGLFIQDCRVGDILPKGGPIGRVMNLQGEITEEIRSPYDQAYIAALRCNYYPTHAGEIAAEAIPVEGHEGF
jgi:uncharacterized protein